MTKVTSQTQEETKMKVNALFARIIGVAALIIGITGAVSSGLALYSIFLPEHQSGAAFAGIGTLFLISGFFLLVGWRLALNRPNQYGSILNPSGWRLLGAMFFVMGVVFVVFVARDWEHALNKISDLMIPTVSCFVFSYLCFKSAKHANREAHD
jgi:hypothetical protein